VNLRTRLVLALVLLSTVGLATFGVATYSLYRRSQERQLDQQLEATSRGQSGRLRVIARFTEIDPDTCAATSSGGATAPSGSTEPGTGGRTNPPPGFAPGQGFDGYAELRQANGTVVACADAVSTRGRPSLPDQVGSVRRYLTTESANGTGQWRVLVAPSETDNRRLGGIGPGGYSPDRGAGVSAADLDGAMVVVAVRTSGIDASMNRLLSIEVLAAVALLTALGIGAWLILRRGLRPLEEMAGSAATINAGDLSQRVEPADGRTEVGQLGLALNTMLDGIEVSFQEREATERRLRQFLSDASHELRTPLTSIQGFAELFRMRTADGGAGPDLPVIFRRIEQESARMKTLVEDLLLLARLDETRPFDPAPVDLTVLAADACSDAAAINADHPITLDAPRPVVVQGDGDHLRQAIANLVTNALKHTPAGTAVEVSTRAAGDQALVTVRDRGPGLDADALVHVFDRFWQADSARVGVGSGLGLSIVASIAVEHGGTAQAANTAEGGAIFTIAVPIALPGTPHPPPR
jgi:two-component system OmpR family sensor kinase